MKIRTQNDVRKLDEKIKSELGVDVSKYKDEEAVESFTELISLPSYVIFSITRPIFVALLIYIFGFYFLKLVHVEYIIYAVVGLILFLIAGIFFGVLYLVFKMKNDISNIVDYSLDILTLSIQDLSNVTQHINAKNKEDVLSLLFKGIIHIVTIPLFSEVIASKTLFAGFFAKKIVKNTLTLISDKLTFDEIDDTKKEIEKNDNNSFLVSCVTTISNVSDGLEKFINFIFRIVKIPLFLIFGSVFILLVFFLYIIN